MIVEKGKIDEVALNALVQAQPAGDGVHGALTVETLFHPATHTKHAANRLIGDRSAGRLWQTARFSGENAGKSTHCI